MTGPDEPRREPRRFVPATDEHDDEHEARPFGPPTRTLPDLGPVLPVRPPVEPPTGEGMGAPMSEHWDEPEPARRDLYDRTAWIERMAWRNAFLVMFVIGVVSYAFEWLAWPYAAALAVGGLVPGLFLMAREQAERNVEADRAAMRPETRHDGTLPPLRRTIHRPLELDE